MLRTSETLAATTILAKSYETADKKDTEKIRAFEPLNQRQPSADISRKRGNNVSLPMKQSIGEA